MACRSAVTSPHTTTVHTLIRISTVRMGGRGWWRRRRCDVRRTSRGAGRRFRVEMAGRGTVCPVWRPGASPWHGSDHDVYVGVLRVTHSGKTTLLNVLSMGEPLETCPTIGLNVKRVKRGGVNLKCWYDRCDTLACPPVQLAALCVTLRAAVVRTAVTVRDIGGQKQYRSEWARYTRGCDVIIFVVDAYAVRLLALWSCAVCYSLCLSAS